MIDLQNKEFRASIITDPNAVLGTTGVNYKVVKCTANLVYIAIPKKDAGLDVSSVSAGSDVACISSAGSVGSVGSACTTLASVSSAGTAGSMSANAIRSGVLDLFGSAIK